MCLIAYVPSGTELADDVYTAAVTDNNDGIGIMSARGVARFVGKKQLKKAKRYIRRELLPDAVPYAIHFRFATHGDVNLQNTHPFILPDNASYMMHNGVISWCGYDAVRSDTGVFADLLDDYPGQENAAYLKELSSIIGSGNKLCIMNRDGSFSLVNADSGLWDNGIWYSNTYSLPHRLDPWRHKSYTLGSYTGRSNVIPFRDTQSWLDKYDASKAAKELDWERDLRISGGKDVESNLHGCGLPVPHGYRIKSQADYYASIDAAQCVTCGGTLQPTAGQDSCDCSDIDSDLEATLSEQGDHWLDSYDIADDSEQEELDNALLDMRRMGAI